MSRRLPKKKTLGALLFQQMSRRDYLENARTSSAIQKIGQIDHRRLYHFVWITLHIMCFNYTIKKRPISTIALHTKTGRRESIEWITSAIGIFLPRIGKDWLTLLMHCKFREMVLSFPRWEGMPSRFAAWRTTDYYLSRAECGKYAAKTGVETRVVRKSSTNPIYFCW